MDINNLLIIPNVPSFDDMSFPNAQSEFRELYEFERYENLSDNITNIDFNNLKCWYCDLNFNNKPIGIPKDNEKMEGNFCGVCCAKAYIYSEYKHNMIELNLQYDKLLYLYKKLNNIPLSKNIHIENAPRKTLRQEYGGTLSVTEYKDILNKLNSNIHKY